MEKKCSKCGQIKPLSEFVKRDSAKDGYRNICKDCSKQYHNKYHRQWYEDNITKRLKQISEYSKTIQGRDNSKKSLNKYQRSKKGQDRARDYRRTEKGKNIFALAIKKYSENNPEKRKAKDKINHLIAAGKLPKVSTLICSRCQVKQAKHYHHPDYSKPLEVIPLCIQCHIDVHHNS